jgi:hypothetical protein
MEIELENMKKTIAIMRKEIDFIKQSLFTGDTRRHFEINLSYTDNTIFDKDTFVRLLISRIPLEHISFSSSYTIDCKYFSNLFPDLKMYNNKITIFIITKNALLPETFKSNLSKVLKYEYNLNHYKDAKSFYNSSACYDNLQPYNINNMIIY